MKQIYLETILLIERVHRRFLDVVKSELDRLKMEDINNGHIVSLRIYADHMPAFQSLLAESGGDLDLFFDRVERLEP